MNITDTFDKSWSPIVGLLYQEPLKSLNEKVLPNISYQPKKENIFRIFSMPVKDIKIVILGQDPYPASGVSIGRAFAVSETTKVPVSLRNIQEELKNESILIDNSSDWKTLEHWEEQGVFLLNTALTVETGKSGSHLYFWEYFTQRVVSYISYKNPCIWLLWGRKAQSFKPYIHNRYNVFGYDEETIGEIPANSDWNYILQASHPAAEVYSNSAGFFGCKHFLFANKILSKTKSSSVLW